MDLWPGRTGEQFLKNLINIRSSGQQLINCRDNRHVDAHFLCQPGQHRCGERPLRNRLAVAHQFGG